MATDIVTRLQVDPMLPDTLAQQIRAQLTWLISSGVLSPDDELPPARSLAASLGVNFHTVRGAYRKLEEDGLVESRRGRRSRVARFEPRHLWPQERAARTHLVGVVLPSLANPFYADLLEGAQDAARHSDTMLVVVTTRDDQAFALRSIAQLAAKGADGVVVVSHDISTLVEQAADAAGDRRLPLVTIDRPGSHGHSVEADLDSAGYLAARHLVEDGHRAIGLVTIQGPPSNVAPIETGLRRALDEAGLRLQDQDVIRAEGWDLLAGAAAIRALTGPDGRLTGPDRPTALVAISDLLAISTIRALGHAGLRVPADMAVTGIDDIQLAALVEPALTTVSLPARSMGVRALEVLERLWDGAVDRPARSVLDVQLTIRESCGPHAS
ncbi:MAG: hypothetical protein A2V85_02545 [Chloroflexi bacterium RBG_16_72_14]|nr:MAG: hypothetical protein A2V85_02545 [Chloroflexi bacterium RBG_16_72_14]